MSSSRSIRVNRPDLRVAQLERRCQVLERGVFDYQRVKRSLLLLQEWVRPVAVESELIRIGSTLDGGYWIPQDLVEGASGAVSIGVGQNIEAECALVHRGLKVHAWDHTIEKLPRESKGITFHQIGIRGSTFSENCLPLPEILDGSFPEGTGNLIVMLDVEGSEWESLANVATEVMERIDVLTVEMHGMGDLLNDDSSFRHVFEIIRRTHLPVSVSANNYGAHWKFDHEIDFPDVIEVTFIRKGSTLILESHEGFIDQVLNTEQLPLIDIRWLNRSFHDPS